MTLDDQSQNLETVPEPVEALPITLLESAGDAHVIDSEDSNGG